MREILRRVAALEAGRSSANCLDCALEFLDQPGERGARICVHRGYSIVAAIQELDAFQAEASSHAGP